MRKHKGRLILISDQKITTAYYEVRVVRSKTIKQKAREWGTSEGLVTTRLNKHEEYLLVEKQISKPDLKKFIHYWDMRERERIAAEMREDTVNVIRSTSGARG